MPRALGQVVWGCGLSALALPAHVDLFGLMGGGFPCYPSAGVTSRPSPLRCLENSLKGILPGRPLRFACLAGPSPSPSPGSGSSSSFSSSEEEPRPELVPWQPRLQGELLLGDLSGRRAPSGPASTTQLQGTPDRAGLPSGQGPGLPSPARHSPMGDPGATEPTEHSRLSAGEPNLTRELKTDTGVGFLLTLETDMGLRVPSKSWMLIKLEFSMGELGPGRAKWRPTTLQRGHELYMCTCVYACICVCVRVRVRDN